jgi:hypothetical protein
METLAAAPTLTCYDCVENRAVLQGLCGARE